MFGLIEDRQILTSASVLSLLWYVVWVEETNQPHSYIVRKGKAILIAFADKCGCLKIHQKFTIDNLLKVWNLKPCQGPFYTLIY